jgi:hypothetical protein
MTISTHDHSDFFIRAFAAVAILAPILFVMIAGSLPEGLARGQLIVFGYGGIVLALATALVLRTVYGLGFSKACRLAASKSNHQFSTKQTA